MVIGWYFIKMGILCMFHGNPKWPPPQDIVFIIGPHVKMNQNFFTEIRQY